MPETKRRCFIDLDGVLADVHAHIAREFSCPIPPERPAPWLYITQALGDDFWKKLDAEFWTSVPPTPWHRDLLTVVEAAFPGGEVCIVTDAQGLAQATVGKMAWIERHMPSYARSRTLIGSGKHFCAAPGRVLVDDSESNVEAFAMGGGRGLLFPREWNALHWIADDKRVYFVQNELRWYR